MKTYLTILGIVANTTCFAAGGLIGGGGGSVSTTPTTNIVDTTTLSGGVTYTNLSGSNLLVVATIYNSGIAKQSSLMVDNNNDGTYEVTNSFGHNLAAGIQETGLLMGTVNPSGRYILTLDSGSSVLSSQQ